MSDRANARVSSAAKRRWTNSAAQKAVKYIKNIHVKLLDRQNLLTYIKCGYKISLIQLIDGIHYSKHQRKSVMPRGQRIYWLSAVL